MQPAKKYKAVYLAFLLLFTQLVSFQGLAQTNTTKYFGSLIERGKLHQKSPNPTARISSVISRPGSSQDFIAVQGGGWNHVSNSNYNYNVAGNLTLRLTKEALTNQNMERESYSFDQYGNLTEELYELWQNGAWQIHSGDKYIFTYNAAGDITEAIGQEPTPTGWEDVAKTIITYYPNGARQEADFFFWNNNAWELAAREIYFNSNGLITEIRLQQYKSGIWEDEARLIAITWAIPNKEAAQFTAQLMQNNLWENTVRETISRDAFGGYVILKEEFVNNAWENYDRFSEIYDNKKNNIGRISEQWGNGQWLVDQMEDHTLTYDAADNVTQRVIQSAFSQNGGILEDSYKYIYSNFLHFSVAGISEHALKELKATVYPNPAHNLVQIDLPQPESPLNLSITDLTGKLVLTKRYVEAGKKHVNISSLPPGIFLLHLETPEGKTVWKIVKN